MQVVWKQTFGGVDEKRALSIASSLERFSSHPIAACIIGKAAVMGASLDLPVEGAQNLPGALGLSKL